MSQPYSMYAATEIKEIRWHFFIQPVAQFSRHQIVVDEETIFHFYTFLIRREIASYS